MLKKAAYPALVILLVLSLVTAAFPLGLLSLDTEASADEHASSTALRDDGAGALGPGGGAGADGAPRDGSADSAATSRGLGDLATPAATWTSPPVSPPLPPDHLNEVAQLLIDAGSLLAGAPVELPRLDLDLPAVNPLRFALLEWIAATQSDVPADELDAALADADALPVPVQRDLAVLLLAASQATVLQRTAMAGLSPDDIAFIENHPDAVAALLEGRAHDPAAARVAELASKIDTAKSVQATVLMLAAIQETRDSLRAYDADDLAGRSKLPELIAPAENALALLGALDAAKANAYADFTATDRLTLAGDLLASASGITAADDPRPYAPADLSTSAHPLPDALMALLHAAHPTVDADVITLLGPEFAQANALPLELQGALALVVKARAENIIAVREAFLGGASPEEAARRDAIGALKTLSAIDQALPVLEKFNVVWSQAPRAQRLGMVDPAIGYADAVLQSNALAQNSGSLESALRAAGATLKINAEPASFGNIEFNAAYLRLSDVLGIATPDAERAEVAAVAATLAPEVRRAAALLMAGNAEATLAQRAAFADLSPAEVAFLKNNIEAVQAIVDAPSSTPDEVAFLRDYADLAARVDGAKLLAGSLTLARAADLAKKSLDDAERRYQAEGGVVTTQSAVTAARPTGLAAWWQSFTDVVAQWSPIGTARAQTAVDPFGCTQQNAAFQNCGRGVLFNIPQRMIILDRTNSVVDPILLGSASARSIPVLLDLGGHDTFRISNGGVGDVHAPGSNAAGPNSLGAAADTAGFSIIHFDYAGNDFYDAPRTYLEAPLDPNSESHPWVGTNGAGLGGIGLLVDYGGQDTYRSFSHAQGFGWLGVGVLADYGLSGDSYTAPFLAQGATYGGFGFSLGLLLDRGGDDHYTLTTKRGQGYALGGILLDLDGEDSYAPSSAVPTGIATTAYMEVGQEPGAALGERGDDRLWVDGPNVVQKGIGLDTRLILEDEDNDGAPTLIESLFGSNPEDLYSTPQDATESKVFNATRDTDRDGFPDAVESALGTDPADARSAPASLPTAAIAAIPTLGPAFLEVLSEVYAADGRDRDFGAGDKLLDIRVPFPGNTFHKEALCTNFFSGSAPRSSIEPATSFLVAGGENEDFKAVVGNSPCRPLGSSGHNYGFVAGGGNTTLSDDGKMTHAGRPGEEISLKVPVGLFALGDIVSTRYTVDYLVSIDIGGSELYRNRAGGGGALVLNIKDSSKGAGIGTFDAASTTIPVGYLTLDFDRPTQAAQIPGGGIDTYYGAALGSEPALDLAQGAGSGILVDVTGGDRYFAGAASQGAYAGLLIDLDPQSADFYSAGERSQGAVATAPFQFPTGVQSADSHKRTNSTLNHFYLARPSLMLDFGGNDQYFAGHRSQGYARGLASASTSGSDRGAMSSPIALLADFQGNDVFDTAVANGRFAQGVARGGALGVLADFGGNDAYSVTGGIGQGAIEPETFRRPLQTNENDALKDLGGVGALLDFGGNDSYRVKQEFSIADRSVKRQNTITFTPEGGTRITNTGRAAVITTGAGLHVDGSQSGGDVDNDGVPDFFEFVAGTNGADRNDTPSDRNQNGFLLNLPSARFAVGGLGDQVYSRDYAFVVDFGGKNTHRNNAGGPIVDIPVMDGGASQARMLLTAFPVTFVYEVANADTSYIASRDYAQGVGYFTVGLVVDEGGADSFRVEPTYVPVIPSVYSERPVAFDGVLGIDEWAGALNLSDRNGRYLVFQDLNASANLKKVEFFVMNDLEKVSIAVRYTPSEGTGTTAEDILSNTWFDFAFDNEHDHLAWVADGDANPCAGPAGRAGTDGVRLSRTGVEDRYLDAQAQRKVWVNDCATGIVTNQDARGRRVLRDGSMIVELTKPVSGTDTRQDLVLAPDGLGGWLNNEVGFRMAFGNRLTGETFAWPPRSAATDGETGSGTLEDGQFTEELFTWSKLTFAAHPNREAAKKFTRAESDALGAAVTGVNLTGLKGTPVTPHTNTRYLSQGAAIGGVGLLLMTGNVKSSGTYEADTAGQGFGGYGGLGVFYDAGGSDTYRGRTFTQGSQAVSGTGVFIEVEGNDRYEAQAFSQGFAFGVARAPAVPGTTSGLSLLADYGGAVFLDQGGADHYAYGQEAQRTTLRADTSGAAAHPSLPREVSAQFATGSSAALNDRVWTQAAGSPGLQPYGGIGIDYRAAEDTYYEIAEFSKANTWNATVRYKVGTINETGVCNDQAPKNANYAAPLYVVEGKACLKAFVFFQNQYIEGSSPTAMPTPPGVTVDRVDVMVDGVLVGSLTEGKPMTASQFGMTVKQNPTPPWQTRFDHRGLEFTLEPWDTSSFEDGPRRVRFTGYYSTTWESLGFHSAGATYPSLEGGQGPYTPQRVLFGTPVEGAVFVDNAPRIAAQAQPQLPGGQGPGFSPFAVGAPRALTLDWAPSHDMGEDRLEYAGYSLTERNEPCPDQAPTTVNPRLCNVLPFYIIDAGAKLSNVRPLKPDWDPSTVKYVDDGAVIEFELKNPLKDNLVLEAGSTMRLVLYRTPLVQSEYTTTVELFRPPNDPNAVLKNTVTSARIGDLTMPVGGDDLDGVRSAVNGQITNLAAILTGIVDNADNAAETIEQLINDQSNIGDDVTELSGSLVDTLLGLGSGSDLRCVVTCATWPGDLYEPARPGRDEAYRLCTTALLATYCNTFDPSGDIPKIGPPGNLQYERPRLRVSTLMDKIDDFYHNGHYGELSAGRVYVRETQVPSPSDPTGPPSETLGGWVPLSVDVVTPSGVPTMHELWADANCALDAYYYDSCSTSILPAAPTFTFSPQVAASGPQTSGEQGGGAPADNPQSDAGTDSHGQTAGDNWETIVLTVPALDTLPNGRDGLILQTGEKFRFRVKTEYNDSPGRLVKDEFACSNIKQTIVDAGTPVPVAGPFVPVYAEQARVICSDRFDPEQGLSPEVVIRWEAESFPSRVEFIVPAEPATLVTVDANRRLLNATGAIIGWSTDEVLEQPTRAWEGELDGCTKVGGPRATCRTTVWSGATRENGRYDLNLTGRTVTPPLHPLAADRADRTGATTTVGVLLDNTPPVTTLTMPQTAAMKAAGEMRSVLGRGFLTSGTTFPIRWAVEDPGAGAPFFTGSGLDRTQVWVAPALDDGSVPDFDTTVWKVVKAGTVDGSLAPTVREVKHVANAGESSFYVAVIARDVVGNIESLPQGWAYAPCITGTASKATCITRGFHDAVREKINLTRANGNDPAGLYRIDLDLGVPTLSSPGITGAHDGVVNGIVRTIVQSGSDVRFNVCATDGSGESGVERVNTYFVFVPEDPTAEILSHTFPMSGSGVANCFTFAGWGAVNTNKTKFPDGPWAVGFEAFDRGANRIELALDDLYLDSVAPTVTAWRVDLPLGQTAAKAGDRVDVLIGVDESIAIAADRTVLDATSLGVTDPVRFTPVNLGDFNYRASVTVGANVARGDRAVTWTVTDAAGNTGTRTVVVPVDDRTPAIVPGSLVVQSTDHDSAVIRFQTTVPASPVVQFGFSAFDLRKATTATDEYGTTHTVTVSDLAPSTRYFAKAVATGPSGLRAESAVLDFLTGSALFLGNINLQPRDAISGDYELTWDGGVRTENGRAKFLVHVRDGQGPWEFLTSTSSAAARHDVTLNTSRLLDGSAFTLRVTAESGADAKNRTVGPFTIDNTAPRLEITSGKKATRDARPVITGTARDTLSGVDADSFRLIVDGKELSPLGFQVTRAGATSSFTYEIPTPLSFGRHNIQVIVRDLAGVQTSETYSLAIDLVPPEASTLPVTYTPGPSAAKRGADVTLAVRASDGSSIETVHADLGALVASEAKTLEFSESETQPGVWSGVFTFDGEAADGTIGVPVRVADPAGNAVTVTVPVTVDTRAPVLAGVSAQDVNFDAARIAATADEPVKLTVTYEADQDQGSAESGDRSANPVVTLKGLLPSRAYAFTARATDGAGNVAEATGTFRTIQDATPPSGVTRLQVRDLQHGVIRLEWAAATDDVGISHYRVYRAAGTGAFAVIAETKDTFHVDNGLPLEVEHRYRVAAVDHGANEGLASAVMAGRSTAPPVLSEGAVTPDAGSGGATSFKFTVKYASAGGVAPAYVRVVIDGTPREMQLMEGSDPKEGLVYAFTTTLGATTLQQPHTYRFEASDGRYVVKFPADKAVNGPVVSGDLLAEKASGLVNFAKRVPVAGSVSVLAAVGVAALLAVVVVRRRSAS